MDRKNCTMMCDFYELTMANGYFESGLKDQICYFDVFFRDIPDKAGYAICAGLEQVVHYIQNLHFSEEDINYLRSQNVFTETFLEYLKDFKFTGDIYAVKEGTPIFPNEPIMIVRAKAIEAQFIETFVLSTLNHQSLIATKASRIVRAAGEKSVSEFGARRAHGSEAATLGARAAYIAGCTGTSCTLTGRKFGVPVTGTMAHSWVQMFENEYEAFKHYCLMYPHQVVLLVDTYNVIKSGVPNAIKVFDEILKPQGHRPIGIRIDSGDVAYLSKKARKMLDEAGYPDCKIIASNSLDEYIIRDLEFQGAKIDSFGVGERLITSKSDPVFGGVYKLTAIEDKEGRVIPKIKISENLSKITNPHFKKLYRIFDKETNKALADLICVYDETIDESKPLEIFDPDATWKRKTLTNFYVRELLTPIFKNGKLVYDLPNVHEIRKYCLDELNTIWDEIKRFEQPHRYYVDLSQKLWDIKHEMLTNEKSKY
ncbi:MAG TPA: nicotinate phosphoribosyltransferase [Acholeplasmataceae bacterium]|nr:nicotinate phosphoribosyltransferase [Acholeplasmataceae bacterium]